MENYKRRSIPMQEKLRLSKSQGASTPDELKHMQNVPYASAVGSIMYDVRCTRPDVANTKDMFLVYRVLNRGAVDWKSAKQSIFATSFTEAEYIAAYDASKEAVWVRKFISGLGVPAVVAAARRKGVDREMVGRRARQRGCDDGEGDLSPLWWCLMASVWWQRRLDGWGGARVEGVGWCGGDGAAGE
ncbi:hypothetical protein Tco_0717117 [Tanacetum coccineum]